MSNHDTDPIDLDDLFANKKFADYIDSTVQNAISKQFKIDNPPLIARPFLGLLGFIGLNPSARFTIAIVPIVLSVLVTLFILGGHWFYNVTDVDDNRIAIVNSEKKIDIVTRNVGEIVAQLNSFLDGYYFETIDLSNKFGSTIYLPVTSKNITSLKIYANNINTNELEELKDGNYLQFKINDKAVFGDDGASVGWSSANRLFENTAIPEKYRNELIFDKDLTQKFQFRIFINEEDEERYNNLWDLYANHTKYSVLFFFTRRFEVGEVNPEGPDIQDENM
ncbi:hypothetical protein AAFN47_23350 [Hoeflea sp. CAU 1731]